MLLTLLLLFTSSLRCVSFTPPSPRWHHRRDRVPPRRASEQENVIVRKVTNWLKDPEFVEDVRVYTKTLALCLSIRFLIVEPRYIPSVSMVPTFEIGDQLAVEKVTKRTRPLVSKDPYPIHRNEVVVFHPPQAFKDLVASKRDEALIKRVVAVAGDEVEVKNGILYVNGLPQSEDNIINERPRYDFPSMVVPPGQLFVLGDNRNQSLDSHVWGFLPVDNVIGRAVFKYWPPSRVGLVEAP